MKRVQHAEPQSGSDLPTSTRRPTVRSWGLAILWLSLSGMEIAIVQAQDWMTAGSYYTHNSNTGQRVHQYAPNPVVAHTPDPFMSVYRQQRSSMNFRGSFDHYHKVYQFGDIVRPYGEWERPFRPYSVPFSDWAYGSPFGHLAYPPRTNPLLPSPILVPGFGPGPFPGPFPGPGPFPSPFPGP